MKTSINVSIVLSLLTWGLIASTVQGCREADAQWLEEEAEAEPPGTSMHTLEGVVLRGGDLVEMTLQPLSLKDLRLLRNTVYARHGRIFVDKELAAYFFAQKWYRANLNYSDDMLTVEDHRNIAALLTAEGRPEDASWQQALGISKQAEEMHRVTGALDVINAYLTDKHALADGDAPEGFELPPLEYYKQAGIVVPLTEKAE